MKKTLFALVMLAAMAASGTVKAQDYPQHILGVRAGATFSSVSVSVGSLSATSDSRTGFQAGVSYQYLLPVSIPLYVESGLYYYQKGYKVSNMGEFNMSYNAQYLEAPLLANYHFKVVDDVEIIPSAGLYFAYGISKGFDNARFDMGARFGVGATYKKFYLGFNYDLGLLNVAKQASDYDEGSQKVRSWGISVGYNF